MYTLLLFAMSFEWGAPGGPSVYHYHDVEPALRGLSIEHPIQIAGFKTEQLCTEAAGKIKAGLAADRNVGYTIMAGGDGKVDKRYEYDLAGKDLTFVCVKSS